jgi:hypothetical protein
MNAACIFILTVNAIVGVYGSPTQGTQAPIYQLNPGDRVCVLEINDDAMAVHWSNGAQGHSGWLRHVHVGKPAVEAVPSYQEN